MNGIFRSAGHRGNKEGRFKDNVSYFLGYHADDGTIQWDSEHRRERKFLQQEVDQVIIKTVESET